MRVSFVFQRCHHTSQTHVLGFKIRTPLNTVWLGLQLLDTELQERSTSSSSSENSSVECTKAGDASRWLELTGDIMENTDSAISVLNDLLNYDKVESGSLQMEIGEIDIWTLVKKTVGHFQIHARNRKIALKMLVSANDCSECDIDIESRGVEQNKKTYETLVTLGDDMRLTQVIRNVVSNALKVRAAIFLFQE